MLEHHGEEESVLNTKGKTTFCRFLIRKLNEMSFSLCK